MSWSGRRDEEMSWGGRRVPSEIKTTRKKKRCDLQEKGRKEKGGANLRFYSLMYNIRDRI